MNTAVCGRVTWRVGRLAAIAWLLLAWPSSCRWGTPAPTQLAKSSVEAGMSLSVLEDTRFRGLSALAVDDHGAIWTLPEQQRVLLRLRVDGPQLRIDGAPVPIEGIESAVDTESLAWVGNDTFVVGTEAEDERASDALIWLRVKDGHARVIRQEPLPYALWGVEATDNHGIEGLCHVAGELWVAVETVVEVEGSRCAPMARYDMAQGRWKPGRAVLTSGTGKVSALACHVVDGDTLEAIAVERHFGVTHLWRYVISRRWDADDRIEVRPEQVIDLSRAMKPLPNFEGLARLPDGRLLLVSDNHYGGVTGSTYGLTLSIPPVK